MLVIELKPGEAVRLTLPDGRPIVVEMVQTYFGWYGGQRARIGVTADPEIPVHRSEIWDAIQEAIRDQKRAAAVPPGGADAGNGHLRPPDAPPDAPPGPAAPGPPQALAEGPAARPPP